MTDSQSSQDSPNPVGRPTSYDKEYNDQAYKLCLLGATDIEIAEFFGICEKTLNNWKHQFPEFLQSLRDGKEKADAHIARKLFNRAEGAEWIEDAAFKVKREEYDDQGRKVVHEEVVTVPVRKAAPPDTTAAVFWLKNRKSGKWRDKQEHEMTGANGKDLIPSRVTIEHVRPKDSTS